jgi:hypothetical protein
MAASIVYCLICIVVLGFICVPQGSSGALKAGFIERPGSSTRINGESRPRHSNVDSHPGPSPEYPTNSNILSHHLYKFGLAWLFPGLVVRNLTEVACWDLRN